MIYFDKPTQRRLLQRFWKALIPGGLLVVGHSEALLDTESGFASMGETMYRRKDPA
jgi:chemotaxis protein methyltransferase CheR